MGDLPFFRRIIYAFIAQAICTIHTYAHNVHPVSKLHWNVGNRFHSDRRAWFVGALIVERIDTEAVPTVPPFLGLGGLRWDGEETQEEGWDRSSCQARCEAGGYARKNMKHCTHRERGITSAHTIPRT